MVLHIFAYIFPPDGDISQANEEKFHLDNLPDFWFRDSIECVY